MSLKKMINLRHTLAFRLTIWYTGVFTVIAFLTISLFYFFATNVIQRQTDGDLLNQMRKFSSLIAAEGVNAGQRVAIIESQAGGVKKVFFRFLHSSGQVFSSSNMDYWQDIDINYGTMRRLIHGGVPVFETIILPERDHEIRVLYGVIGPGVILQVGQSMEEYGRIISIFKRIFIGAVTFLIVLAALVGWFMARHALSGVEAVTKTAQMISRDALDMRVPVKPRGDEIDALANTFNEMLGRIEKLVTGMKEMSDSIAHDLRTPVTRIRGIAEITLTTETGQAEYETMTASIIEECDRLLDIISTMLVISRFEAGVGDLKKEETDLAGIVKNACELFRPIAEDKKLSIDYRAAEFLDYTGDAGMLQRLISNLLDNAIKYTPSGGDVTIVLEKQNDNVMVLTVGDTGAGIAETELVHIFERFYRGDESRSTEGTGLGLSLARAIARAHGGDITVKSEPGKGSIFTVTL
ncbi:MAG: HAMP domain-containing protein [Deltaproteobacteria bacterium]|nr:HAMP domain-containing protein [Deltaproteobacteria bacterium]MBW2595319.1 HAMP domain-containing protein [Deltaproteobacteria bacterium]MBW2649983.1 HAMP domain-containing protein [Deltaproteobacteria bacterium]